MNILYIEPALEIFFPIKICQSQQDVTVIIKPHKYLGFLKVDAVSVKVRQLVSNVHVLIWYLNIQDCIKLKSPGLRDFGAVLVRLCVVHQMSSGVLMIALHISVVFKEAVTVVDIWRARVSLKRGCSFFQYAVSFLFQ